MVVGKVVGDMYAQVLLLLVSERRKSNAGADASHVGENIGYTAKDEVLSMVVGNALRVCESRSAGGSALSQG
jgi:hypothetical protein